MIVPLRRHHGKERVAWCPLLALSRYRPVQRTCLLSGASRHEFLRKSAFTVAIGGKADMPFCTAYVR